MRTALFLLACWIATTASLGAQDVSETWPDLAASARGFPAMRDLDGRTLADGDFAQWIENDRLHLRVRYDFRDGRQIEEHAVFQPGDAMAQERWEWSERRDGRIVRRFEVDFPAGRASGETREGGEIQRWQEDVEIEPGRTFAGFGFTIALKAFRQRLVEGETVELEAVAFTPEPRTVGVEVSHGGRERMEMGGRTLEGRRFDIVPQVPWIAQLFVDAPDTRIWLTDPPPAEFLRWEGALLEPDDPVVRVDFLPGGESGPARPVGGGSR